MRNLEFKNALQTPSKPNNFRMIFDGLQIAFEFAPKDSFSLKNDLKAKLKENGGTVSYVVNKQVGLSLIFIFFLLLLHIVNLVAVCLICFPLSWVVAHGHVTI